MKTDNEELFSCVSLKKKNCLYLQGDEPAIRRNDQRLAALMELSKKVVPLKLRRLKITKPITAIALCDWNDENVREDKYDIHDIIEKKILESSSLVHHVLYLF